MNDTSHVNGHFFGKNNIRTLSHYYLNNFHILGLKLVLLCIIMYTSISSLTLYDFSHTH